MLLTYMWRGALERPAEPGDAPGEELVRTEGRKGALEASQHSPSLTRGAADH